ncbi:ATP-binding cassette domain-containing protein [Candidatus Uhrbacteria bacterium]|nr:ATP-binding cassette domain-containing protein [Candidatus Uhrbacteria bacterium]MBD3284470.1 ATP-binding cassette domain-containing protein [Candidatus Uhrbacteria bacterium]
MGERMDDLDKRPVASNWKEYLAEFRDTQTSIAWVWRELVTQQTRRALKKMLGLTILFAAIHMSLPYFVSLMFDGLLQHSWQQLMLGFGLFALCIVLKETLQYAQRVTREWILGFVMGKLDDRITELFFEKSLGQHIDRSTELSISNIDKGRWKAFELVMSVSLEGLPSILLLLFAFGFLWILSPVAGSIMTIAICLHLVWAVYLNTQVNRVCIPIEKDFRKLNRHRIERWEKVERVRINETVQKELDHMRGFWDDIITKDRRFWIWFIGNATLRGAMLYLGLILVTIYSIHRVWNGDWSVALLYPVFFWTMDLVDNLWRLGHLEHQLNWNMPAVRSMIEAVSISPDIDERAEGPVVDARHGIRIEMVGLTHAFVDAGQSDDQPRHETRVLRDVSFTIEPGEKVALLGPSGAGKSTIMRLLLRFMDPQSGQIRINGVDLRDLNLRSWMRLVGYIPQKACIFDGTIRYNLDYGSLVGETSDDGLWALMRKLKIDFSGRLTNGLDTIVGRDGVKLSGGQAQRLMVGAAAAKHPKFMIIDEATSSLDSTTEKWVQQGLAEVLTNDVGALIVAHRLSTVRNICTKFIVLRTVDELVTDELQIEAMGSSFRELYDVSPTFRTLFDDQRLEL